MDDEKLVTEDTLEPQDVELELDIEDETEDLAAELAKAKEVAHNQKIRAEKAEAKLKNGTKEVVKESSNALTIKDQMALFNAKVNEDDIEEVLDYAKYRNISVAEALKSTVIKATLAEKEEFRNSAKASIAGNQRRGVAKITEETILNNAQKGNLPESDEDIQKLFLARKGIKG